MNKIVSASGPGVKVPGAAYDQTASIAAWLSKV